MLNIQTCFSSFIKDLPNDLSHMKLLCKMLSLLGLCCNAFILFYTNLWCPLLLCYDYYTFPAIQHYVEC